MIDSPLRTNDSWQSPAAGPAMNGFEGTLLRSFACPELRRRDFLLRLRQDFVDETVLLGLSGVEVTIPLGIFFDDGNRLTRVTRQDLVERGSGLEDILGLDFDVGDLA